MSLLNSFWLFLGSLSLCLQEPNAPPGVCINFLISELFSMLVSIKSSLRIPTIPSFPAKSLSIFLDFREASITPQAVAFMTEVTPPDWA